MWVGLEDTAEADVATTVTLMMSKSVQQKKDTTCWAAALESWLDVTPGVTKFTQDQLVAAYGDPTDGGLVIAKFERIVGRLGMTAERMYAKEFSADKMADLLKKKGHLFFGYLVPGAPGDKETWWHDVVVHEVNFSGGGATTYGAMDPATGAKAVFTQGTFFNLGGRLVCGSRAN